MPAFATLTGFARGGASLNATQLERVKRAAEFIAQSWRGTSPIMSIRITGYIDANESQSDLGQRRAAAVRDALLRALGSARPDWRRGFGGSWKTAGSLLSQRWRFIYGTGRPHHQCHR